MNEQDELFFDLPKRPMSHIIGDQAILVLRNSLPKEWIYRELHSDYGIDGEIEVVKSDGNVTGAICKVQVKGTNSDVELLKYGISVSTTTVRYWVALPLLTIIVRIISNPKKVLWISVRKYLLEAGLLDILYSTRKKTIHFNFKNAYELPQTIKELEELITENQIEINNFRSETEAIEKGDFFGFIALVHVYENDPDKMIKWLRENGSHDQLINDLPFAIWVKRQSEEDFGLLNRIYSMVMSITKGDNIILD
ncbi:hypothetical protein ES708_15951 [subsurface metagenome]